MNVIRLLLLQLFELMNLLVVLHDYLCPVVGMYWFVDLPVVLYMSQIQVL